MMDRLKSKHYRKVKRRPYRRNNREFASVINPVLFRGPLNGTPSRIYGQSNTRKRIDLPLSIPGAEIQIPRLPSIQFSWRMLSGVVAIGLFILLTTLWRSPTFRVNQVEIDGVSSLNPNEMLAVLGLKNQLVFTLDMKHIRAVLMDAFPELKTAVVKIDFPVKIHISVVERVPAVLWHQKNSTFWFDTYGIPFHVRGDLGQLVEIYTMDDVIQDRDVFNTETPLFSPEILNAVISMDSYKPEGATLLYSKINGLGWTDPRGWDVYFGKGVQNMQEKLLVYDVLINRFDQDGIHPVLINIGYLHMPFYRTAW